MAATPEVKRILKGVTEEELHEIKWTTKTPEIKSILADIKDGDDGIKRAFYRIFGLTVTTFDDDEIGVK